MTSQDDPKPTSGLRSFGRDVGRGLAEEGREWLRWARGGAIIGATALGGGGLYFFGLQGLGIGIAIGVIVGAIGAWLFYLSASNLF